MSSVNGEQAEFSELAMPTNPISGRFAAAADQDRNLGTIPRAHEPLSNSTSFQSGPYQAGATIRAPVYAGEYTSNHVFDAYGRSIRVQNTAYNQAVPHFTQGALLNAFQGEQIDNNYGSLPGTSNNNDTQYNPGFLESPAWAQPVLEQNLPQNYDPSQQQWAKLPSLQGHAHILELDQAGQRAPEHLPETPNKARNSTPRAKKTPKARFQAPDGEDEGEADPDAKRAKQLLENREQRYRGTIRNYADFARLKHAYDNSDNEKKSGDLLKGFPSDPDKIQEKLEELFDAITNVKDILDGTRKKPKSWKPQAVAAGSKRKRADDNPDGGEDDEGSVEEDAQGHDEGKYEAQDDDATQPKDVIDSLAKIRVQKLAGFEVELLAAQVLYAVRDSQLGENSIPPWAKTKSSRAKGDEYDSFTERFDAVVGALRKSKTFVCSLLETDFVKRAASAPDGELKLKIGNKKINEQRNKQVEAGKKALKQEAD